jgi:hypothetical protein
LSFHLHVGMSPHDGAGGGVGDSIKVWSEAAHMAASLTLLQITQRSPDECSI